jgi:hypothetical protein
MMMMREGGGGGGGGGGGTGIQEIRTGGRIKETVDTAT